MAAPIPTFQLNARQTQTQTQVLSPRLQQAVRLLQMSSMEFAQNLSDEAGRNPFLDTEENEEGEGNALPPVLTALTRAASESEAADASAENAPTPAANEEQRLNDNEPSAQSPSDEPRDWVESKSSSGAGGSEDFNPMDLVPEPQSLRSHLRAQLNVLPLSRRDLVLAQTVVDSLDDDGYLRMSAEELLNAAALDPMAEADEVSIALRRVQALDPAGVGARSVQECLLLQVGKINAPTQRALAQRILQEHLKLLAAHDHAGLAAALQAPLSEVEEVCAHIRRFEPRPGSTFGATRISYVVPDVVVRRQGKRWVAMLNPQVVPRVRLNQNVVDLYLQNRGSATPVLTSHLQEARWALRNVEQRFSTIVAVAQAIIDRQHHFLEYGEVAMQPLGLREIAAEVGVHESTVSRVTSNKFIATPVGVFELKHFFSRAMVMPSGASCSGTAIRGLVRDIIASEPAGRPLSDAQITQILSQQGLEVARRTVTKYRQALRIAPVARRRRVGAEG